MPDDFTKYICHIGNVSEIYSITRSGLIPGGRSLERDRQSVSAVNPMDDGQSMDEIRYDLDKPRIAPYKNTWRPHQTKVFWCNLKLAQKKGLQFFLARSHAIVLYNTLPAICIEKAVCMKTKEELYHKVFQSPRLPRVKLKPNSKSGHQTTEAFRKLAETTSTFEFQAYLILQFNNWTRIAEKRSKSWFSSSRITRTRCSSCRTWRRPKRLIRSAKGGRSWSPTWAIRRSSSFAKRLPRKNAPIVLYMGK